jgi:hypothetical protein
VAQGPEFKPQYHKKNLMYNTSLFEIVTMNSPRTINIIKMEEKKKVTMQVEHP